MRIKGFTLVELLVVIIVIAIIGTLGVSSYSAMMSQSRDIKRKSDLSDVAKALEIYFLKNGSYQVAYSGSGSASGGWGCGCGWLSYSYGGTSVIEALHNLGYLKNREINDPNASSTSSIESYMIYPCNNGLTYALTATLESPTQKDIDAAKRTCASGYANETDPGATTWGTVSRYGKNFAVYNKSMW